MPFPSGEPIGFHAIYKHTHEYLSCSVGKMKDIDVVTKQEERLD